jgi:hypothetical protein
VSFHPADGMLFQEQGRPEIYLIRGGERLWIPNPYVMEALSLDWSAVETVPAGTLDDIARDRSWEALGDSTPGSTVFVPTRVGLFGLAGQVYYALPLATTKRHEAWGREVRTIELRGWIGPPGGPNGLDPDFSYELEVDVRWVLDRGIDLSELLRVGNILGIGAPDPGITEPRAWCARPLIKMEISGFPPRLQQERAHPPDWTKTLPGVVLEDESAAAYGQLVQWPFDPAAPPPSNTPIQGGEYVRVFGSVVSDKAHPPDPDKDPPMRDAVLQWRTGGGNNYDDQARWTEIHPPDWIEILRPSESATQTLRGVTVVAPGTYPWKAPIESVLDVDIQAPPRPRPDAILHYREIVGPETVDATIVEGNTSMTGALITPLANADGIHVHIAVAGARSFTGGGPGKFRALYWLYWEVPEFTPAAAAPSVSLLLLDDDPRTGVDPIPILLLDG